MNNFSSAYSIITALLSRKVAMLIVACEGKATEILQTLDSELTPLTYFETLHQVGMTKLIPSLGVVGSLRTPYLLTFSSQTSTFPPSIPSFSALIPSLWWRDVI